MLTDDPDRDIDRAILDHWRSMGGKAEAAADAADLYREGAGWQQQPVGCERCETSGLVRDPDAARDGDDRWIVCPNCEGERFVIDYVSLG